MSKKSLFRGPFNKSYGKSAETMLKSERQHFYHIYWSLRRQSRSKKRLWVICEILGLFVNQLTAVDKDSLLNRGNLLQHVQMQLYQKRKIFFNFFFLHFLNFYWILNISKKKMSLIADVFVKLRTPKNLVR